mgnify:CR=1 FL=1
MKIPPLDNKYDFKNNKILYGKMGKGEPLIIVHGTPWSSYNMRHLIFKLSKHFSVYYYDLLGYGKSDKPDSDVSLGIQNKILSGLINHWKLKKPNILGHDFGGAITLRTLLIDKIQFNKIVLIDPVAISPWGSEFFLHVKKHEKAFSDITNYIHEAIIKSYIKTAAHKKINENVLSATIKPWLENTGKAGFYRQIAQANSQYTDEIQKLYPIINSPVLILWGKEDKWIPVSKGIKLNKMIKSSILKIIPDSGHLVIEEKPKVLVKHIRNFLT